MGKCMVLLTLCSNWISLIQTPGRGTKSDPVPSVQWRTEKQLHVVAVVRSSETCRTLWFASLHMTPNTPDSIAGTTKYLNFMVLIT